MRIARVMLRPSVLIATVAAAGALLLLLPTRSVSIDWGGGGGVGEWVPTPYANNRNNICYAVDPDDQCKEWCQVSAQTGALVPTGQLCCIGADGVCNARDIFI